MHQPPSKQGLSAVSMTMRRNAGPSASRLMSHGPHRGNSLETLYRLQQLHLMRKERNKPLHAAKLCYKPHKYNILNDFKGIFFSVCENKSERIFK